MCPVPLHGSLRVLRGYSASVGNYFAWRPSRAGVREAKSWRLLSCLLCWSQVQANNSGSSMAQQESPTVKFSLAAVAALAPMCLVWLSERARGSLKAKMPKRRCLEMIGLSSDLMSNAREMWRTSTALSLGRAADTDAPSSGSSESSGALPERKGKVD